MTKDLRRSIEVLWALLVACALSLVMSGTARADAFLGVYDLVTDKNEAACLALSGESYVTLDNGLKTRLFNSTVDGGAGTDESPNFSDYALFRNSLYQHQYNWYSTMDGFQYSWAFSAAQKDLEGAFRWWTAYGDTVDKPSDSVGGTGFYVLIRDSVTTDETLVWPDGYTYTFNSGMAATYNSRLGKTHIVYIAQSNMIATYATAIYARQGERSLARPQPHLVMTRVLPTCHTSKVLIM